MVKAVTGTGDPDISAVDLGGGRVSVADNVKDSLVIREERQRLRWKTALLWGSALTAIVMLVAFLEAVWFYLDQELSYTHVVMLIILAGIPTLILANLMKLVGRSNAPSSDDIDGSPWSMIFRELVTALTRWLQKQT